MKAKPKLDHRSVRMIERSLEAKRAELTDALRRKIAEGRVQPIGRAGDDAAWATEILRDEIEVALVDQRSRELKETEAALEQLARGEYGVCRDCGDFIGWNRLRALPFARRCSPCQSRAEQEAREPLRSVPAGVAVADREAE